MSQLMKKRFPSITSIDVGSDGNTSFLRAARNGQLDKVLEHLKSNIDINTSNANGLNALHLASKDGHVEIVAELLKRGAVVDAATKKGNTALHIASLAGQEEVVKLLVHHGASVNVQSQNGFTPLYMAAQENHDNVVKFLLANGANQSLSTEDGFTPLAVAMQQGHDKVVTVLLENDTRGKIRLPALHIAAKKDDVKAAKLLLENEHNPDVTSKSGFTPLHIASHYGNQSIANLLIQKGADVNYSAKHNITPLHVAAKWGKTNMVAILLENGATIESKTRDGLTPLHCAARSGHEQVVDMLLERGAPISSKTKNGLAPLHMAAQGDHVDAARILLYHRAPVDEVTVDYLTALHVAAHCGHVRVAKLLLDRQADANARALNGFTPLHIACKKNRIKVVELLLKHGASIGATTESGLTPLHVASFMGCMNIVIYLLQHDANPDVPTVRGETPLHLAARANQTDIIRILLRNGAQVDARAREQQTPLHIASRLGNVDIVMLLLQHGAKVDNTTKDMYTSLHIAAKEGQDEVAAVLIENGASLNATTKKGFTPLHLASKYGHLKVAKLLLQKDAPVDAQGKNGVTPLHVAAHYDHQNVALLLLDKGASPHATAKNGHTPLHIAARKNQMDIANTLLEYGAQPNAESKAGFTPLHLSSQEGHTDMSSLLIEHKANPNHEAKNGLAPLHLCAQEDRVPVAEILVKHGAEINAPTKSGYTPLHVASHYGQVNMVRFLLGNGADVQSTTSIGYTPLHQAAQQGHTNIVNVLLENNADPNAVTASGQTPLDIAQKLGYITVIETLKVVTTTTTITTTTTTSLEEKYKVVAPEAMHETFMSDSEEEGGEDTVLGDQTYRYLTADEMKSLGDDSLPIDVTRDERIDSNRMVSSADSNMLPPQHIEDTISPEHVQQNYVEYIKKFVPDNVDIARHPINIGFLVSFLVDARGGAMRGCRHSGVRVIVPPRCAPSPTRITCRYVRPQRTPHPPPLMEGEALASRVLELGPVGAKFLGPVIIEVPHFAALRGKEREIVILRSDNGESWKEHTVDATEEVLNEVLNDSFEAEDLNQMEDISSGRITRIVTQDFPQYFAVVSRIRQEVHAIGPEGGMVSSTVVPQVQAVFPQGALTKKIKVGLQAQPIDPELTAKLLGHGVAVSPVVTVEPRRRKFHKAITLSMPTPRAHSQGMINQYSGSSPTLRLLCSITGGTSRAQWEDVTGSTPFTFVNDCVSFTTTVSARFWLMDCRNIGDATKMATELYREAIHVPFMAKFVVFAKRVDPLEARLRVFCMTDDKEDKTLEHQEHFTEVAKSRDVEVLEGKSQYIEFAGNLVPITKSGEQLQFSFRAFRENRLPFSVRVKDQHAEAVSRCLFMKEPKVAKGEPPQQPICILNIVLPDDIVTETISLSDTDSLKKHIYLSENFDYYRPDPRLADMSNLLGEDWVPLANQLGLTTSEINVIKSEYPDSVAKQAQSMLRMWLSQSSNKAQTNTLENALRRIGREDIIPQCLNVDHTGQGITRIKQEEIGKYRLKKDSSLDRDIMRDAESIEELAKEDKIYADTFDKYSAEEKVVEKSDEEEDFSKTVTERRQQIEQRLSSERSIPASSQRVEIVQEITSIKRQSLVEDKINEVKQKITQEPTTAIPEKMVVTETIETKTTPPSKSIVSEIDQVPVAHKVEQVREITTITETRTKVPEDQYAHKTAEEAELLEGVTQHFETTKKPIPKLIADEEPRSPKFSKTPPPSPADFLQRDQAATVQEWDATRKPTEPLSSPGQAIERDAAQIGIPTSTSKYLDSSEEKQLVIIPVGDLYNQNNLFANIKPVYDQTNAFIESESRPEPYNVNTEHYFTTQRERIVDVEKPDSAKEEKKTKKGIIGTIKTFVTKSFDHSDSDSEKSPKKDKKKKDKKKKKKSSDAELPPEVPARPPRKPKLPTPTETRKEYADIPYVEAPNDLPPAYKPPDVPVKDQLQPVQITDLDADTDTEIPDTVKDQAQEIIKDIITDGENTATDILQKYPKSKTSKVTIVEEVTKTFQPAAIEEEEFSIVVDPTKKESPKKSKETFTINIDESIDLIEKELLEKSPILPEEKIMKPLIDLDGPVRPPRIKNHIYEDIQEPSIIYKVEVDENLKKVITDLIHNEREFSGWADDKHNIINKPKEEHQKQMEQKITDSQKLKRKHGKLFGFFGKSAKEADESDEDTRKDAADKPDETVIKEKKIEEEEEPRKAGFLGLFAKKQKKDEQTVTDVVLSEAVIKDMGDSASFLKEEVSNYEDVMLKITEPKSAQFEETTKKFVTQSPKILRGKSKEKDEKPKHSDVGSADVHELSQGEFVTKEKKIEADEEPKKAGFLGLFGKKPKKVELKAIVLSEAVIKDMEDTDKFLKDEVTNYEDIKLKVAETKPSQIEEVSKKRQVSQSPKLLKGKSKEKEEKSKQPDMVTADLQELKQSEIVIEEKKIKTEDEPEKVGLLGLFGKKTRKEEHKVTEVILSETVIKDMDDTAKFLKDEVANYEDAKPNIIELKSAEIETSKKLELSPQLLRGKSKEKEEKFKQPEMSTEIIQESKEKVTTPKPKMKKAKSKERDEKPKKADVVNDQKKGGFLGLFKKSKKESFEEETENKIVLPESVAKDMKDSTNFLDQEITNYHDVRPIVKLEESKTERTEGLTERLPRESRKEDAIKSEPVRDLHETTNFLNTELEKYEDDKPVAIKDIKIVKIIDVQEPEPIIIKPLSQNVLIDMVNTTNFLQDEISNYHDVRPTVMSTDVSPKVAEKEEEKHRNVKLFDFFGKKLRSPESVEENEVDKAQEVMKPKSAEPVARTPVLTSEREDQVDKDEKDYFKSPSKKVMPEEMFAEPEVDQAESAPLEKILLDTSSFLQGEIINFNDVKIIPSKKEYDDMEDELSEKETKISGFFGIFSKKTKKDKNIDEPKKDVITDSIDVVDLEEKSKSSKDAKENKESGLFGLFTKKSKTANDISKPPSETIKDSEIGTVPKIKLAENKEIDERSFVEHFDTKSKPTEDVHSEITTVPDSTLQNIIDSADFLNTEISNYHDAKPAISPKVVKHVEFVEPEFEVKEQIDTWGVAKEVTAGQAPQAEIKEEPKIVRTKIIETVSNLELTDLDKKGSVSEQVLKDMKDTSNFLDEEVTRYEDGEYKTPQKTHTEHEKPKKGKKSGILEIFGIKKPDPDVSSIKEEIIHVKEETTTNLGEAVKNLETTAAFLEGELVQYEDVSVQKQIPELDTSRKEVVQHKEQADLDIEIEKKQKKSGIFEVFSKRKSEEKDNLPIKPKDTVVGKEVTTKEQLIHSIRDEDTKAVDETSSFLHEEVSRYEDGKYIRIQPPIFETEKSEKEKRSVLFSIFGKKKTEEEDLVAEKPKISATVMENIEATSAFLEEELSRYEDNKIAPKQQQIPKSDKLEEIELPCEEREFHAHADIEIKEKKSGIFEIFSKRKSEERDTTVKKPKDITEITNEEQLAVHSPLEETVETLAKRTSFLKEEISRYEDGIHLPTQIPKEIQEEAKEQEKEKKSVLFAIFGKKKPEKVDTVCQNVEAQSIRQEESKTTPVQKQISEFEKPEKLLAHYEDTTGRKTLLSDQVTRDMKTTSAFLNDEVSRYDDGHFISRQKLIAKEEKSEAQKKPGIFDIFGKSKSEERDVHIEKFGDVEVSAKEGILKPRGEKEKKPGLFGLFHKKKSEEREMVPPECGEKIVEPITEVSEKGISNKDKKVFGIFNKMKSEEKDLVSSEFDSKTSIDELPVTAKYIDDSSEFLKEEIVRYEDVRPSIKEKVPPESQKLENDKKTGGVFGFFSRGKSEEREVFEEQHGTKSTDTDSKQIPRERKKSGSPFKIFSKQESEKSNIFVEELPQPTISEGVLQQLQDTHNFLTTELNNYEDSEFKPIADIDKDIDESGMKTSGLFNIFSKRDKKESPKVAKKKYKKHKRERSEEEPEKVGIIEKIGRKLTGSGSDANEDISYVTSQVEDELKEDIDQFTATVRKADDDLLRERSNVELKIEQAVATVDGVIDDASLIISERTFIDDLDDKYNKNLQNGKYKLQSEIEKGIKDIADSTKIDFKETKDEVGETTTIIGEKAEKFRDAVEELATATSSKMSEQLTAKLDDSKELKKDVEVGIEEKQNIVSDVVRETARVVKSLDDNFDKSSKDGKNYVEKASKKSGGFLSKFGVKLSSKTEEAKEDLKETKENLEEKGSEVIGELNLNIQQAGAQSQVVVKDIKQHEEVPDESQKDVKQKHKKIKKGAGFFSKLGEKISGKSVEVKEGVVSSSSDIKTATESLLQDLKETKDDLSSSDKFEDNLETMKDDTSNFVSEMMQSFEEKLEHAKESDEGITRKETTTASEAAVECIKQYGDKLKEDMERLDKSISTSVEEGTESQLKICEEYIKEKLQSGVEEKDKLLSKIVKEKEDSQKVGEHIQIRTAEIVGGITSVEDTSKLAADKIGDAIGDIKKATEWAVMASDKITSDTFVGKSDDNLKDTEAKYKQKIINAAEITKDTIDPMKKDAEETVLDIKDSTMKISDGLVEKTEEKVSEKLRDVEKHVSSEFETIKFQTKELTEPVLETTTSLIKKPQEVLQKSVDKTKSVMKDFDTNVTNAVQKIDAALRETQHSIEKSTSDTSDTINESVGEIISKSSHVGDKIASAEEIVSDPTQDTFAEVKDGMHTDDKLMQSSAKHDIEVLKNRGIKSKDEFKQSSQKIAMEFKDKSNELLETNKDMIQASIADVTTIVDNVEDKAESIIVQDLGLVEVGESVVMPDVEGKKYKGKKKSGGILGKLGRKLSGGKGDETKIKSKDEKVEDKIEKTKDIVDKKMKDGSSFFNKLGDKISGKVTELEKHADQVTHGIVKGEDEVVSSTDRNICELSDHAMDVGKDLNLKRDETSSSIKQSVADLEQSIKIQSIKLRSDINDVKFDAESNIEKSKDSVIGKLHELMPGDVEDGNKIAADDSKMKVSESESQLGTAKDEVDDKIQSIPGQARSYTRSFGKDIKSAAFILREPSMSEEKTPQILDDSKQKSKELLDSLRTHADTLQADAYGTMTRTISDNVGRMGYLEEDWENAYKISETNIDLSNLPTDVDYDPRKPKLVATKSDCSSYVTSPTLARRAASQRLVDAERPVVKEISSMRSEELSDDESYIVTEPDEASPSTYQAVDSDTEKRRPLFHIESEEDDSTEAKLRERRDSVKSNVLEILTDIKLDSLLCDLTKKMEQDMETTITSVDTNIIKKEEKLLEDHKKESKAEVDLIEQKLRDLDKALDSLEQIDLEIKTDTSNDDSKTQKKLRRVERKFERMASEIMDKEIAEAKQEKMTTPEMEDRREKDFQKLVSQLSTEEMSDFQKEYGHLWDENTFSKSDEWDSKTPDSQADAQELPQGEIAEHAASQEGHQSALKAEGDEPQERESSERTQTRQVADQHQLSDEMKELLKELEKESKQ